jgi:galactosyl transferase GMA12/MNN10 family
MKKFYAIIFIGSVMVNRSFANTVDVGYMADVDDPIAHDTADITDQRGCGCGGGGSQVTTSSIPIVSKKKSDVVLLSLYTPGYAPGPYSEKNKREYAKKHGYDLNTYHQTLDASRPPSWSKILAIQKHLHESKWIFWSDADSLIMNSDIKLESLIDNKFDLIITREATGKDLNCGVFLIKNSSWSRQLLKNIYAQAQFINDPLWEQSALRHLLKTNPSLYKNIKILPQRAMNSHISEKGGEYKPGDFIIHLYGPVDKANLIKVFYDKSLKK